MLDQSYVLTYLANSINFCNDQRLSSEYITRRRTLQGTYLLRTYTYVGLGLRNGLHERSLFSGSHDLMLASSQLSSELSLVPQHGNKWSQKIRYCSNSHICRYSPIHIGLFLADTNELGLR